MKGKLLSFVLAVILLMGVTAKVYAVETGTGTIRVTIVSGEELNVVVSGSLNIGTLVVGETWMSPTNNDRIVVRSTSNVTVDYHVRQSTPAGWTTGSAIGENQYVLQGIFTEWNRGTLDASDFGAEDVITINNQTSSATLFAWDSEDVSFKGFNIPPFDSGNVTANDRSLNFRFLAPSSITINAGDEQTIVITATVVRP